MPKPWYRSYLSAKAAMQQDLFGTNPTMAAVLDLWHKTFGYNPVITFSVNSKTVSLNATIFVMLQWNLAV